VVIKLSRLNIVAQGLSNPPLVVIHASLSGGLLPVCRQAGWWSPLLETWEVAQHLHFTHTVRLAWWCRATLHLSHPEAVHWASPRDRPQHWYVKEAHATSQKKDDSGETGSSFTSVRTN